MRNDRDDNRRNRPSWRDIDRSRERSRTRDHGSQEKPVSSASDQAQKSYRAALERAFEAGKLGELAKTITRTSDPQYGTHSPAATQPAPPAAPPSPSSAPSSASSSSSSSSPLAPAATSPAMPPSRSGPPGSPSFLPNDRGDGTGTIDSPTTTASPAAPLPQAAPLSSSANLPPPPRDSERENRQKLLARIREAEGREPVSRSIDAYLAKYPRLPDDFEVLTKALSHRNDQRVRTALEQLKALIAKEKPRRARTLVAQLRFLEDTHSEPEIRREAAEVRGRL
ncbi:MAG: hypothetical protein V2A73_21000 [Pseudomonadota bacterium]